MGRSIKRLKQVIEQTGLSKSVIYEKIADGTFPKQIKLTARSIGFVESEVDEWIEQRIVNRDNNEEAKC